MRWFPGKIDPPIRSALNQPALLRPEYVDKIKADMLAGEFRYASREGQIVGYQDEFGAYYVSDGCHRVNAALEILWDTGDSTCLNMLLQYGKWEDWQGGKSYRFATRTVWSRLLAIVEFW